MPTTLTKNIRIFVQCMRIQWVTLGEYKENFFFDFITRTFGFMLFWFSWQTILGETSIPGWDLSGLLLFAGFNHIFLSLVLMFAYGAYQLNDAIVHGKLDNYLARPCNEWFVISCQNGFMAFAGFVIGVAILAIAWASGVFEIDLLEAVLIAFMLLIGTGIAYTFGLLIAALTFWLGKNQLYEHLFWGIFEFDFYPTNIFPGAIQIVIAFTVPFMLVLTLPSLFLLDRVPLEEVLRWILASLIILGANIVVFRRVWKEGLKRYEAFGG